MINIHIGKLFVKKDISRQEIESSGRFIFNRDLNTVKYSFIAIFAALNF